MFLKCSYFRHLMSILVKIAKKMQVLETAKPKNVLSMFLNLWPRSLMFLYTLFLLEKNVYFLKVA